MPTPLSTVGSTTFAANYNRVVDYFPNSSATAANPVTYTQTRRLRWYKVTSLTGVFTNPGNADSVFQKAIRGVQLVAELAYAYTPATGVFICAVFEDTDNGNGVGNTNNDIIMEDAIETSTGVTGTTVSSTLTDVFQTS
jgi:hypothetical protein